MTIGVAADLDVPASYCDRVDQPHVQDRLVAGQGGRPDVADVHSKLIRLGAPALEPCRAHGVVELRYDDAAAGT